MSKILVQVILILVSVGLFFAVIDPLYRGNSEEKPSIQAINASIAEYDAALDNAKKLDEALQDLTKKKREIKTEDLDQLEKLLPDSIDNILLIININAIAARNGIVLKNIKFEGDTKDSKAKKPGSQSATPSVSVGGVPGEDTSAPSADSGIAHGVSGTVGAVTLTFTTTTKYETFKVFLRDLEESLRVVDVSKISIKPNEKGLSDYGFTIRTYWLRE